LAGIPKVYEYVEAYMGDRRPKVQFRMDHDVFESFERYRSDKDRSKSEAGRELTRAGLDARGYSPTGSTGSPLETMASTWTLALGGLVLVFGALVMGVGALLATSPTTVYLLAAGGAALVSVGTALVLVAALAQILLADPLANLVGIDRIKRYVESKTQ
jgi:hypothetical protein